MKWIKRLRERKLRKQALGYYINDDIAKSQVAYLFLTGEYTKALQLQNELEKNRAKLKRAGYGVMSKYSDEEILKAIDFLDKSSNSVQEE